LFATGEKKLSEKYDPPPIPPTASSGQAQGGLRYVMDFKSLGDGGVKRGV